MNAFAATRSYYSSILCIQIYASIVKLIHFLVFHFISCAKVSVNPFDSFVAVNKLNVSRTKKKKKAEEAQAIDLFDHML